MKIREIMTQHIETVDADATVRDVAELMRRLDVGVIPVVDQSRVAGVITDRDVCLRCVADNRNANHTPAREIMSSDVRTASEDDDVRDAANLMKRDQIRRLIVVDSEDRAVGMVSLGDLAVHCNDEKVTADALEEISKPCEPARGT